MSPKQPATYDRANAAQVAPLAYSIKDAGRALSISRASVYRELAAGRLKARRAGGRVLIPATSVAAWLNALPIAHSRAA